MQEKRKKLLDKSPLMCYNKTIKGKENPKKPEGSAPMKSNDTVTYTMLNGITITASREYVNQLRREQADRAREIAAKQVKRSYSPRPSARAQKVLLDNLKKICYNNYRK